MVCGESDHDVLQFDHKDGLQGEVRVSGIRLYARLRRENWPDYIQLLCANCHIRKTTNKNSPRPTARLSSRELTIHAAEVLSVGDRRVWREHVRSNYLIVENARGMWRVEVRPHRGQNLPFDTNILMVQQGSRSFKYTADKGHPRRWHGNFIEATEQLT